MESQTTAWFYLKHHFEYNELVQCLLVLLPRHESKNGRLIIVVDRECDTNQKVKVSRNVTHWSTRENGYFK